MEKKVKFIIIILIGIIIVSIIINLQTYNAKQSLEGKRDKLIAENTSLSQKVEESQQKAKKLEERLFSFSKELDKISKEKEEFQRKLDLLKKEKEELVARLMKAQKESEVVKEAEAPKQPQVAEDSYWAKVLKEKKDLELQLGNMRKELKDGKINYEQLQREKNNLELEINNLIRDKEDLRRQFEYNQKIFDSLSHDLVVEKNDKERITDSQKLFKNQNEVLRRQLRGLTERKIDLERKLVELQEENRSLNDRFAKAEALLEAKVSQAADFRKDLQAELKSPAPAGEEKVTVELPPIVVRPAGQIATPGSEAAPLKTGKVLAVNKENNFVIIDLGQDAGIMMGNTFEVYRRDQPVATIEVIQVRREIAACDIKKETTPIEVGDTIR